jgi:hypothetical protein
MRLSITRYFYLIVLFYVIFYCYFLIQDQLLNNDRKQVSFNKTNDFIIFLHIGKTGGRYFEDKVVKYLKIFSEKEKTWKPVCYRQTPDKKFNISARFYCPRDENKVDENNFANNWFFSVKTFDLIYGLHSDFSNFKSRLQKIKQENKYLNKFYFITFIREPIQRYVSEWYHIQYNGDLWSESSQNYCNKETLMPECYSKRQPDNITLEEFIACKNNTGNNRQTRWLADYYHNGEFNCQIFNHENKKLLLQNAKNVLVNLAYLGLTEYEHLSDMLFEKTFNNIFMYKDKANRTQKAYASTILEKLNDTVIEQIRKLNDLDLELYKFAKKIFFERLEYYKIV